MRREFDRLAYDINSPKHVLWGFKIIQDALKILFYNVVVRLCSACLIID